MDSGLVQFIIIILGVCVIILIGARLFKCCCMKVIKVWMFTFGHWNIIHFQQHNFVDLEGPRISVVSVPEYRPQTSYGPPKYEDIFPETTNDENRHMWKNLWLFNSIWYQELTLSSQFIFFCGLLSQNLNDSDIEAISHRLRKWTKAIRDDKKQELLVNDWTLEA